MCMCRRTSCKLISENIIDSRINSLNSSMSFHSFLHLFSLFCSIPFNFHHPKITCFISSAIRYVYGMQQFSIHINFAQKNPFLIMRRELFFNYKAQNLFSYEKNQHTHRITIDSYSSRFSILPPL